MSQRSRSVLLRNLPLLAAATAALAGAPAGAVPVSPGDTNISPMGMTSNDYPWLSGSSLIDEERKIVCPTGEVIGKVQLSVVEESAPPHYIDYYYRIKLYAWSPYSVVNLSTSGFGSAYLDVDYRPDSLGTRAPGYVARASNPLFLFTTPTTTAIAPGEESFALLIHTLSTGTPVADAVVDVATNATNIDAVCQITGAYRP